MIERWVEEFMCRLLHRSAQWETVSVGGKRLGLIWSYECDLDMQEPFIDGYSKFKLPVPVWSEVLAIGSRASLAQHGMRAAERRMARWQTAFAVSVLVALCLFLSGCLTAQKALVWSDTVTAWGTKPSASQECKRASLDTARYLSNANRHIGNATGLDDLPSRAEAKRLMDDAAKKCEEKY